MSDVRRWLDWAPPEIFSGTKSPTKPSKPTKPLPEAGFVSSVGSSSHEFQIFQPETGSVSFVGAPQTKSEILKAGKAYQCDRCGTRFDTSIGRAWHEANNCADVSRAPYEHAALPSCHKCGSYALDRIADGASECETCGANFPTVRMVRRT